MGKKRRFICHCGKRIPAVFGAYIMWAGGEMGGGEMQNHGALQRKKKGDQPKGEANRPKKLQETVPLKQKKGRGKSTEASPQSQRNRKKPDVPDDDDKGILQRKEGKPVGKEITQKIFGKRMGGSGTKDKKTADRPRQQNRNCATEGNEGAGLGCWKVLCAKKKGGKPWWTEQGKFLSKPGSRKGVSSCSKSRKERIRLGGQGGKRREREVRKVGLKEPVNSLKKTVASKNQGGRKGILREGASNSDAGKGIRGGEA